MISVSNSLSLLKHILPGFTCRSMFRTVGRGNSVIAPVSWSSLLWNQVHLLTVALVTHLGERQLWCQTPAVELRLIGRSPAETQFVSCHQFQSKLFIARQQGLAATLLAIPRFECSRGSVAIRQLEWQGKLWCQTTAHTVELWLILLKCTWVCIRKSSSRQWGTERLGESKWFEDITLPQQVSTVEIQFVSGHQAIPVTVVHVSSDAGAV